MAGCVDSLVVWTRGYPTLWCPLSTFWRPLSTLPITIYGSIVGIVRSRIRAQGFRGGARGSGGSDEAAVDVAIRRGAIVVGTSGQRGGTSRNVGMSLVEIELGTSCFRIIFVNCEKRVSGGKGK